MMLKKCTRMHSWDKFLLAIIEGPLSCQRVVICDSPADVCSHLVSEVSGSLSIALAILTYIAPLTLSKHYPAALNKTC